MKKIRICLLFLFFQATIFAQDNYSILSKGFMDPPDSARPRTWWHWTGGNVTLQGIKKDLEWMKESGIAGFQIADVAFGAGPAVEDPILFGTSAWKEALQYAAKEADSLGLEMGVFSSPGWSLTGGPWVKPEEAMKKLVWSKRVVPGPFEFNEKLPAPPKNNGPIRNLDRSTRVDTLNNPTFYRDQAVLAFPTPEDEIPAQSLPLSVTTSSGDSSVDALTDQDLNSSLTIPANRNGDPAWIMFDFGKPVTARAFSIASRDGIPAGRLLAGNDEAHLQTVLTLPGVQNYRSGRVRTFSIPETRARFFRLELTGAPPSPAEVMSQAPYRLPEKYNLAECIIHTESMVNRWEEKAGFYHLFEYGTSSTPEASSSSVIPLENILDLTSKMDADGVLHWKVPDGDWTILRLGYSLTGATNRPAMPTGLGYEVDKLNEDHTEKYFDRYLEQLVSPDDKFTGRVLQYILMDSWEAGMQNWTDDMVLEFRDRRGYDPVPYLPVLTGSIVQSSDESDRFLWDFRRTLADMFAENHYGTAEKFAREHDLGIYAEATGVSLEVLEDALLSKSKVDIPMGEYWVRDLHPRSMYYMDVRGAASASHVYNKPVAAAEAFTGGNFESPYTLKKVADYWFTNGINRLVFHTSTHQPTDLLPGSAMVGTHFHRLITWAGEMKPFTDYLARISFMMQQGDFVADLAYLLNEGAPSTMPFWGEGIRPAPPEGYDFDFVNADAVLRFMEADEDGNLVLPGGQTYRILVLPPTEEMTLPLLKKIRDLVVDGATILGPKIEHTPGLAGYPESEFELFELSEELWGDLDGAAKTRRYVGSGMVAWGEAPGKLLKDTGTPRDVDYIKDLDSDFAWIHRKMEDIEIYFISNQTGKDMKTEFRFRVKGRVPESWDPDDGSVKALSYSCENGLTTVPLDFAPFGSKLVVFHGRAGRDTLTLPAHKETGLEELSGPWDLVFHPGPGNPGSITLRNLTSWTDLDDPAMKYYSGSVSYKMNYKPDRTWPESGSQIILDLGEVKDLARVILNGDTLAILWKKPFAVDITDRLQKGNNILEIVVTNQWTNRLAGDQELPENERVLDYFIRKFGRGWELEESGLLGPVTIKSIEKE